MEENMNENINESINENINENINEIVNENVNVQGEKNNRITIILVGILLLILVVGLILAVSKLVESAANEVRAQLPAWQEMYDGFREAKEKWTSPKPEETPDGNAQKILPEEDFWEYSEPLPEEGGIDEYTYEEEEEYIPAAEDEYYVTLADSIRDDLSYTASKKTYTYMDEDRYVYVMVEYVDTEGLAFSEKINSILEESAMYYARQFGSEEAWNLTLLAESYITYMDEDILSVVISEQFAWNGMMNADLFCLNFDLATGSLLYNTQIIAPSAELAERFREMNRYQNGSLTYVEEISDDEILAYFSDEDALILFYTPVGLEVGFNYDEGWITATLKEYEKYLRRI